MIKTILAAIGLVNVACCLVFFLGFAAFVVRDRARILWRYLKVRRHVAQEADRVTFESHRYDDWARSHAEGPRP